MANSTFDLLEFRAIVKPDLTELYVLCGPTSDGMIGVQGWHKRVYPASAGAWMPLLEADLRSGEYLTSREWSMGAPPDASIPNEIHTALAEIREDLGDPENLVRGMGPMITAKVKVAVDGILAHFRKAS